MTKTLIIYSHPNKDGNSGYFLKTVVKYLDTKKEKYEIIDLYEDKFDPVLKADELYTVGQKNITKENKTYQDKISKATNLIFIHPTWWQNIPAILKGFIDRVFTGGFAFTFKGKMPVGLLKGKNAVILTTTGGPRIFTVLFAGDYALKTMINTTLKFCGLKCKGFSVGKANTLIDENKPKLVKTVNKAMKFLKI